MESAASGRVHRAWHVAGKDQATPAPVRVRLRNGGEQCDGIGVARVAEDLINTGEFDDAPEVHDTNTVTDVLDDG